MLRRVCSEGAPQYHHHTSTPPLDPPPYPLCMRRTTCRGKAPQAKRLAETHHVWSAQPVRARPHRANQPIILRCGCATGCGCLVMCAGCCPGGLRRWYNPPWFDEHIPSEPYDPLKLRAAFEKVRRGPPFLLCGCPQRCPQRYLCGYQSLSLKRRGPQAQGRLWKGEERTSLFSLWMDCRVLGTFLGRATSGTRLPYGPAALSTSGQPFKR